MLRLKYALTLVLLLAAATTAWAVDALGPFRATAQGTGLADFYLETAAGGVIDSDEHDIQVQVNVHRLLQGGNINDQDASGAIVVRDLDRGTTITKQNISFAELFEDEFGNVGVILEGTAKVHDDALGTDNVGGFTCVIINDTFFGIQVASESFLIFYDNATVTTMEVEAL